ncbi:hypothetical protein CK203_093981 [Vitis vinifera]|uniref:Uncharacterized protein n=1 Tax=Vitis vinifera TaxID=29760 RepID=A0A438CKC4_VITVI|nr:hypothetical protein CK203_093981 [Vitis vinifera]
MTPEVLIRRLMLTQPPIEGNLDCRARSFHSELCFDTTLSDFSPSSGTPSIYCRGPRSYCHPLHHRQMSWYSGARHIAKALRIPYEPARLEDYRVWTHPAQSDIVHIPSRGASSR